MKKLLISFMILFCITTVCAFAATSVEFAIGETDYYVQTDAIAKNAAEAAPYIKNDRTMVPVRAICEAFGSDVAWDDTTKTVTITKNDTVVSLVIGSDVIVADGFEKTIDCPAEITNDITFIPLRAVSENLGYYVYYIDYTRQILIDDMLPAMTVNGVDVPFNEVKTFLAINGVEADAQVVYQAYSFLEEIYTMNSHAVKNNTTLSEANVAALKSEMQALKEDPMASELFLSSSYAKLSYDYALANTYAQKLGTDLENSIDEEEFKNYYNENYVCAKHVLIAFDTRSEEEALTVAQEVYTRATAGESFDSLVAEYGEDPGMEANPAGYVFTKGEMVIEFEEATFALAPGEISEPVKTAYGYHVIEKQALPNDEESILYARYSLADRKYNLALNDIFSNVQVTTNVSQADALAALQ